MMAPRHHLVPEFESYFQWPIFDRLIAFWRMIPRQRLESCGRTSTSWKSRCRRYCWRSVLLHRVFGNVRKRQTIWAKAALFCVSTSLIPKPPSIRDVVIVFQATGVQHLYSVYPVHRKLACKDEILAAELMYKTFVPTQYWGIAVKTDCSRTLRPAKDIPDPLQELILERRSVVVMGYMFLTPICSPR